MLTGKYVPTICKDVVSPRSRGGRWGWRANVPNNRISSIRSTAAVLTLKLAISYTVVRSLLLQSYHAISDNTSKCLDNFKLYCITRSGMGVKLLSLFDGGTLATEGVR